MKRKAKPELRVGTSGFTYRHWRGVFYPDDVPQKRWLEFYAEHFDACEINSTYYHMPRRSVCESWRRRTPDGFSFVLKLNRFITHRRKLADCGELLESFLAAAEAERIRGYLQAGLDVHAYFNNDAEACAVKNAAELKKFVEGG